MKKDNRSGMRIIGLIILISVVLFITGLFVGYMRDEIFQTPGDSHSVPPSTH